MIKDKLTDIPSPSDLRKIAVALAVLDAAVDSDRRTMEILPDGTAHFLYDHGSGDEVHLYFPKDAGPLVVGFDHESPMSPYTKNRMYDGVFDGLPAALQRFVIAEPGKGDKFPGTFAKDGAEHPLLAATFAAWWDAAANAWACGTAVFVKTKFHDDGASWLLECLELQHWWDDHEDVEDDAVVDAIAAHQPVSDDQLRALLSDCDVNAVRGLMAKLGYGSPT